MEHESYNVVAFSEHQGLLESIPHFFFFHAVLILGLKFNVTCRVVCRGAS